MKKRSGKRRPETPPEKTVEKPSPDTIAAAFCLLAAVFCLIRFVNSTADFPVGMEMTGVFYTDEGWYSNGAIHNRNFGTWYLEGDFNPMVNLPVHHIIQRAAFSLFGMSLATARGTIGICFIIFAIAMFRIVNIFGGSRPASLVILLLSGNFLFFTYSRIAILEIPMLCFMSLALLTAVSFRNKNNYIVISAASILLTVAALTKSTAVFAVPLLLYCAVIRETNLRKRILLPIAALAAFIIPVVLWNHFAKALHPDDFALFLKVNISDRIQLQPAPFLKNLGTTFIRAVKAQPVIFPAGSIGCIAFLIISREFRKNPLVHLALIWIFTYTILLASTSYHPLRYMLPLAPPAIILFTTALFALRNILPVKIFNISVIITALSFSWYYGDVIIRNLSAAESSFMIMAREVRQIVNRENPNDIVMGNFANSVSLAAGIRSINTSGTKPVEWKIKTYKPRYYLSLGCEPAVIRAIFKSHILTPVGEWNVFRNYIHNKTVNLFRLDARDPRTFGKENP